MHEIKVREEFRKRMLSELYRIMADLNSQCERTEDYKLIVKYYNYYLPNITNYPD